MLSAFRNLGFVLLICFFSLGGVWMYLRNSALADPVRPPPDHPFLSGQFPAIVAYGKVATTAFPQRHVDLKALAALPLAAVAWLPVAFGSTGEPEVRDLQGPKSLKETLRQLPNRRLVLDFLESRPDGLEQILKALDNEVVGERLLIQSPVDHLLKDLREARPRWLFGTSLAVTTRFKMMAAVGLEMVVPIHGDVLVIERLPKNLRDFSPEVFREAHRRHLRVFAGPVDTMDEVKELLNRGADAVMVTDNEVVTSTLAEGSKKK